MKEREKEGINKTILLQEDFRKALSLGLNRDSYAKATTTSSLMGIGLFNSMHYYDVANGKVYRESDEAKKVLCEVYGLDASKYPDLDAAVDAITGFDLAQARKLVDSAYDKAVAAGDLKTTDKVVLTYGTAEDSTVTRRYYNNLVSQWTELMKGTKLEGKFELEFDSSFGTGWANDFRGGAYDVCQGGWTGAAWDPGYFLLAYLSPDYMYASNDNILGGTIGIVRGEMKKAFENASWKNELDSEYVDMIAKLLEFYDGNEIDDAAADVKGLVERYVKVFWDALEDNAKYEEVTQDVMVAGEFVESRVITMTFDEKSVVGFCKDLYNAVKNDSELRALVVKYGDMLSEYTGATGSEIGSYYDELLNELGNELENMDEYMTPGAFIVEVVTPTNASTLRKLSVSWRDGDASAAAETYLTLDLGKDGIKTTNYIKLNIMDEMALVYEITVNDANTYKSSMKLISTYSSGKDTMTAFTVDWNKSSGDFTLDIPEVEFVMGGNIKTAGDTTTIVINKIGYENEVINKGFNYTIIVDENDPMPSVVNKNNVTNVLTLTIDELEAIVDRAEEVFKDVFGSNAEEALPYPDYDYVEKY